MTAQPEQNFAALILRQGGSLWADKTALICDDRTVSYSELSTIANRMALALQNNGADPGSRILIALPDSLSAMTVFLGALLAGVGAALVNNRVMESDYASYLEDCGAKIVFANAGHPALAAADGAGRQGIGLDDTNLDAFLEGLSENFLPPSMTGEEEAVCDTIAT